MFEGATYKTLICVLTPPRFVLSTVFHSQMLTYVVSKSTNQDKNYWKGKTKSLGTQLKIEIYIYFQNKMKILEPARYRCLVRTVFCSPALADFPTSHTLPSLSAHPIIGHDNMSNKE